MPAPSRPASTKPKPIVPALLLAETWTPDADVNGWWMSEKLDGVRAYWDGKQFFSRQGNRFYAPDWFLAGLPNMPLDGELWLGRKAFQRTVSIVRRQDEQRLVARSEVPRVRCAGRPMGHSRSVLSICAIVSQGFVFAMRAFCPRCDAAAPNICRKNSTGSNRWVARGSCSGSRAPGTKPAARQLS